MRIRDLDPLVIRYHYGPLLISLSTMTTCIMVGSVYLVFSDRIPDGSVALAVIAPIDWVSICLIVLTVVIILRSRWSYMRAYSAWRATFEDDWKRREKRVRWTKRMTLPKWLPYPKWGRGGGASYGEFGQDEELPNV